MSNNEQLSELEDAFQNVRKVVVRSVLPPEGLLETPIRTVHYAALFALITVMGMNRLIVGGGLSDTLIFATLVFLFFLLASLPLSYAVHKFGFSDLGENSGYTVSMSLLIGITIVAAGVSFLLLATGIEFNPNDIIGLSNKASVALISTIFTSLCFFGLALAKSGNWLHKLVIYAISGISVFICLFFSLAV